MDPGNVQSPLNPWAARCGAFFVSINRGVSWALALLLVIVAFACGCCCGAFIAILSVSIRLCKALVWLLAGCASACFTTKDVVLLNREEVFAERVGPTGTGELLARWAIQTEVAVERNPSSWDYAGLDIVAGTALRSKFTEWLTGRLKERAQSWQQERLHRNECKQQKGKGKGNIDNDSDDDGREKILRRSEATALRSLFRTDTHGIENFRRARQKEAKAVATASGDSRLRLCERTAIPEHEWESDPLTGRLVHECWLYTLKGGVSDDDAWRLLCAPRSKTGAPSRTLAKSTYVPLPARSVSLDGDPKRWIPVQRTPLHPQVAEEADVVQFLSKGFHVKEFEPTVRLSVIRLGSLHGSCSVSWKTQDRDAVAGLKYIGGEGVIEFGPGESVRTFEIEILNDDYFDPALEFAVILGNPVNCVLGPRLHTTMVVILDDDQFPSNDFSQVIAQKSQAALWEVGGRLLWAFVRFCFTHLRTIRWKSLLVLFLSNLGNVYYLATIFMRVYLVDTVLNTKDPDTADRLWIRNDRNATAIALGLAWVLPNVILLASDYFEMAVLDMGHQIRFYLRAALFRKYLHYTEESRALVPIQALKASIMKNIPDLASQGYLILFHLWAMLGKIVMVSIFILREPPRSPLPLIVYPLFIATYMLCTQRQRLDLLAKESDAKTATNQCIMFMHKCDKLFAAYDKRAEVQRHFEDVLKNQRKWALKMKIFTFWDAKLIPLITKVVTGSYIGLSAWLVSTGNSTLGTIVATINVYEDLGNRFATICEGFKELSQGIGPLAEIVLQFNLATDAWTDRND
ncbi:Integrin beta-4 (GP150) (CD antigen CD104) [Durusdinium trenchii]|uniref:Integrin beta-4 (GP150) (CD antigen CD104) n=1 Tax=Durusdinium trenchii TaxID=1381693 RepID=A0ABP0LA17_9DINO